MHAQNFANLGDYLREFSHALNRKAAVAGMSAFTVEVREDAITADEQDLLK